MHMSNIKHHLSDALLMSYSAGGLSEAVNLMVASHISLCDTCRATVESYDAVGGALIGDSVSAPVAMSDNSLEATLALINQSPVAEPERPISAPGVLPSPLQDYVGGDLESIKWRAVGMGVRQAILPTSKEASARLLYIPAGTAMPDHGHHGLEMTMVLQGAFVDDDEYFARGDVEIAGEETEHMPVADVGQDCICLAVTDGKLKFNSVLPRLMQPFLRI